MRPQTLKIATLRLSGLMERVAHARVPQWPARCPLLLEHERIRSGTVLGGFGQKPLDQIADTQDAAAALALGTPDLLVPPTLLAEF